MLAAELKGGPADGDRGLIDYAPEKMWVSYCEECSEWHWEDTAEPGCEVYVKHSGDGYEVPLVYAYKDMALDPLEALDREAENGKLLAA
jgi:hypothetical protein